METKTPKHYVMYPSLVRRYSDLCHLQTFCPFLSFPSISEPGCQLAGEMPISQGSFLPFPWEASLAWLGTLQGRGCRLPCQDVPHPSTQKPGLAPRAAQSHPQTKLSCPPNTAPRREIGQVHPAEPCPSTLGCLNPSMGT